MSLDLARLKGLVEIMAAERSKECPHLFEDAVQEGLIAAWQAAESRPDAPPAYVHAAARYGVLSVLRGRPMTGEEGRRGWQDAYDYSEPIVATTPDGDEYLVAEPTDPFSERDFANAEVSDDVRAAMKAIEDPLDRTIVYLRYWHDLGFTEIAQIVGRPAGTLSRRWTEIIRPALRERLAGVAHAV